LALDVGLPLLLPGAAIAVGAAAVSSLRQPPDPNRLMLDQTGSMLLFHHGLPPALAMLGPAATLLVRAGLNREPSADPTAVAMSVALNVAIVAALIFGWVRHRDAISGALANPAREAAK
jgi:hypothetical protein